MRAPRSIVDRLFRDLHGALPHDKIVLRRAKQQARPPLPKTSVCQIWSVSATTPYAPAEYQPTQSQQAPYRRGSLGIDLRAGETWLELGASIGAFSLYCKMNRATAVWYEPDSDCLESLSLNVLEFEHHSMPITAQITQ
jgi:hypothetical protein